LTQAEKGLAFAELHKGAGAFIIPNPWDIGSARLLTQLGFEALATSSAGHAFSIGKADNAVGRDAMLAHARYLAAATDLPVSVDLENGFGDTPEVVAETMRRAVATGAVGGSIEDATGRLDDPIYERSLAAERIRAAAEVVRALPFPFILTARCENYLVGKPDLKDTIERLRRYQEAGADVLYAPGLTTKEDIAAVVGAVDRPVNVLMALKGVALSVPELSLLGVKRISVGSALARYALTALLRGAREMREHGTFSFAEEAETFRNINSLFATDRV
jgi:2-methylisocitrate lyase-like PEP mutase family enzyme